MDVPISAKRLRATVPDGRALAQGHAFYRDLSQPAGIQIVPVGDQGGAAASLEDDPLYRPS